MSDATSQPTSERIHVQWTITYDLNSFAAQHGLDASDEETVLDRMQQEAMETFASEVPSRHDVVMVDGAGNDY